MFYLNIYLLFYLILQSKSHFDSNKSKKRSNRKKNISYNIFFIYIQCLHYVYPFIVSLSKVKKTLFVFIFEIEIEKMYSSYFTVSMLLDALQFHWLDYHVLIIKTFFIQFIPLNPHRWVPHYIKKSLIKIMSQKNQTNAKQETSPSANSNFPLFNRTINLFGVLSKFHSKLYFYPNK